MEIVTASKEDIEQYGESSGSLSMEDLMGLVERRNPNAWTVGGDEEGSIRMVADAFEAELRKHGDEGYSSHLIGEPEFTESETRKRKGSELIVVKVVRELLKRGHLVQWNEFHEAYEVFSTNVDLVGLLELQHDLNANPRKKKKSFAERFLGR